MYGNHRHANDLYRFNLDTSTWRNLGASPLLQGHGGPNLLHLCGGKKIAVIPGFAREETADDNKLDSESQSDQCGYNERDYVEETRDNRLTLYTFVFTYS